MTLPVAAEHAGTRWRSAPLSPEPRLQSRHFATARNAPAGEGVHRWLDIGPLHINIAALLLPVLIVGLAAIGIARPLALVAACIVATVLLLQPDASQLTSFAIAASILLVRSPGAPRWKAFGLVVAAVFAIAGWTRPDTLQPVAEVEQIFTLCVAVSPFLALFAGLALAAAAVAPSRFRPQLTIPRGTEQSRCPPTFCPCRSLRSSGGSRSRWSASA